MAKTEVGEATSPNNTTPIQYLHALWERSNAIYNLIDEASPTGPGLDAAAKVKSSWFFDGEMQVHRHASHLQLALLYEQPVTPVDAVILAGHIRSHGSGIDTIVDEYRKEAFEALERAQSSLFAFLAEQMPVEFSGSMASDLRSAQREVALRTGHPDNWDQLREAA